MEHQPNSTSPPNSSSTGESGQLSTEHFIVLIVDDVAGNLIALETLLEEPGRIILKEKNGKDAVKCVMNNHVDLVLLDVNMPGMNGYEVAEILKSNPVTRQVPLIFITAQMKEQVHIMKGYEEGAIDYLIKPLNPEITRSKVKAFQQLAEERRRNQPLPSVFEDSIFVKTGTKYVKVLYDEVLWFEAEDDYVLIHTLKEKFIVHITMKALEPRLPKGFVRVHRSFIINLNHVKSFHPYDLLINGKSIPIGKSYQKQLMDMLNKL